MTTYRLTLVDKINEAEPPKVLYLRGRTRRVAQRRARMATAESEKIVDLVPLD